MRYDKEHKERTHRRLLDEAAAAIRAEGAEHLSVASLMARAGLTHGGFYAHFKSKDDLVDKAVEVSFDQADARFARRTDGRTPAEGLAAHIDHYLSMSHVEHREKGCPLPALSSDMSRLQGPARSRFADGIGRLTHQMTSLLEAMGLPPSEAVQKARSTIAEMVGAVALARAATDTTEARRIVEASRHSIHTRLGLPDQS